MKKLSLLGAVCTILTTTFFSNIAHGAIIQDQIGATVNNGGLGYAVQSFLPAQDNIAGVDVFLSGTASLFADVTASIWDDSAWNGSIFTGTPLVTGIELNVPRNTIAEVRWSAISLTPEQNYYIEFTNNNSLGFGVLLSATDPYTRGEEQTFSTTVFIDVYFSTYYDDEFVSSATVPVPAAIWLFGSGLIGLIGIAKRKKAA